MTARKKLHADEITTDATLVRQLLAAQFPQWAELAIEPVASAGTENAIYRLGDDMAVRLPLRAWKTGVEKEHRWLPKLAPHLPLAVPVPLAKGTPADGYPCVWTVCRWLEGEAVRLKRLTSPVEAAKTLAEFVRALVAIDPTGGPPPGEHNFQRGIPLADRDGYTRDAIAQCEGLIDTAAVTKAWETDLNAPVWDKPPVWLHGDLDPGNMLAIDGRLSAVIDWGGLGVGDPATELLNALEPGLALRVGDVTQATAGQGKGTHTTSAARLIPLSLPDTFVVDTPGIRTFSVRGMAPRDLASHFPNIAALEAGCAYSDRLHSAEPDCAVRTAKHVDPFLRGRYKSYRLMLAELER